MTRPETHRGCPLWLVNALDLLLLALALWCLVPAFVPGREFHLPLPGGDYISSTLSAHNLLSFWVLLLIRLHLKPGLPAPWLARLVGGRPFVQGLVLVIGLTLTAVSAGQSRLWPSGDTIPARLLPISIIGNGDLDLNEFIDGIPPERRYGLFWKDRHALSAYPMGTPLTALPVYALYGLVRAGREPVANAALSLELWSAAIIAALAVLVIWRLALRLGADTESAAWIALACGLGTSLFSTAAIALWQNGPACLWLGLAMLLLLRGRDGGKAWPLAVAGLCTGWAFACRPPTLVLSGVLALWVVKEFRIRALWAFLPCALTLASVFAFNLFVYGSIEGGYSQRAETFAGFSGEALLAMLVSPSRGLFAFSPFLLVALAAGWRCLRRAPLGLPAFCLYASAVCVLFYSFWQGWHGGVAYGPRILTELGLLLGVVLASESGMLKRRPIRSLFLLLAVISCHIHIVGAAHGDHGWSERRFSGQDTSRLWSVRDSQIAWTLRRKASAD